MGRELYAFSKCGKHFVYCGSDGKLKLWDTQTVVLKQEFVPNLHLNSPCSSLIWITVNPTIIPVKNRKRKLEGKHIKLIVIGTTGGSIAFYSLAEAKVVLTLQAGSPATVNCLSWINEAGLFSSSDNVVFHWDITKKAIKSKWKCGKGKITSMLVTSNGKRCVTASFSLKIWDVETHNLLQTLTGHSSDVTSLVFVNQQYFLSAASNDRYISAWSLNAESEEPVGRFAMNDSISSNLNVIETDGVITVTAVTKSGTLQLFKHQLNGKCGKPVKPSLTVEIASEKFTGTTVTNLPIVANCLTLSSVWIAYGFPPKFQFEPLDIRDTKEKRLSLVRSESVKPLVNNLKVGETISENVEYVHSGGGVKRKADNNKLDVPMEERLGNLSIDPADVNSTAKPSPHNMAQLLLQGLESKDKAILESVLFRRDPLVISETVSRLPIQALGPLIEELISLLQTKTLTSGIATVWLKRVVVTHASQLLSSTRTRGPLAGLHRLVETRSLTLPPLTSLAGRLDLLLEQLDEPSHNNLSNTDALLVYQDEESSDEAGSFFGEAEGSESEDRWEELSDQDVDDTTEDANTSS